MSRVRNEEICGACGGRIEADRVNEYTICSACQVNIDRASDAEVDAVAEEVFEQDAEILEHLADN